MMENAGYAEHSQQCVVSLEGLHKSAVLSAVKDAIVAWAEQNQPAKSLYHQHIPLMLPPDAQESAFPSIHPLLEWGRSLSALLYYTCLQLSCKKRDGRCRKHPESPGCCKERSAPEQSCALSKSHDSWCVLKEWRLPGHGVSQAWEARVDARTPPKSRTAAKIVISLRKKWDNKGFSLLIPLMLQSKDVSLSREELLTG